MEKFVNFFLKNKAFTWLLLFLVLAGGSVAYVKMGKLEDAPFTIKQALVLTSYPGASPEEVQSQVTDVLEEAIQSLGELYYLKTDNRSGLSKITVYVKKEIRADEMQQLWDKLRRKVNDAQAKLPAGAGPSVVKDDFGDVLGVFYALSSDTHSNRELEEYSKQLKNKLLNVKDVAKVERFGILSPSVEVEISPSIMARTGITTSDIAQAFQKQNTVVDAGGLDNETNRLRIDASGSFGSLDEIRNMVITSAGGEYFTLGDIAEVSESYVKPVTNMMYVDNTPSVGIAISTVPDGNVVDMAVAVKECVDNFADTLPDGINVSCIYDQGYESDIANRGFILNLILSVITVVAILLFFIGFRNGLIVGSGLVFSIFATLIYMWASKIALQRMSLAAIIIAMGMLVDNAIVVFDSALVNMQRGMKKREAIMKAVSGTAVPLLAATVIAVMSFVPIYLSPHITGELLSSLVIVIGVSLMASWVFAITQNAFFIQEYVPELSSAESGKDPFQGKMYDRFRKLLRGVIRHRFLLVSCVVVALAVSLFAFTKVPRVFVPELNKQYFTIDMWMPEGTRIEKMDEIAQSVSEYVSGYDEVEQVSLYVGQTPPRYYLANASRGPQPNCAQLLVKTSSPEEARAIRPRISEEARKMFPEAYIRANPFNLNTIPDAMIEARFTGDDPAVLDSLVGIAMDIMNRNPKADNVCNEWGNMAMNIRADYDPVRAGKLGISKSSIMESSKSVSDGLPIGVFRDNEKKVPVVLKSSQEINADTDALKNLSVWNGSRSAPLSQVSRAVECDWEWPLIRTYNRRLSMAARCDVVEGATMKEVLNEIKDEVESIELPEGYEFFWDSQYKDEKEGMEALGKYFPLAVIALALILVALFGNLRQPVIIFLMLPLSFIGVVVGLLVTGSDFGFFPIAGWLGLLGMIIKNIIVLLDEINIQISKGLDYNTAVIEATVSRTKPVLMAAITTVLGMIPLLFDVVFKGMAATITFGLTFATALTLLVTPALFIIFYGNKK